MIPTYIQKCHDYVDDMRLAYRVIPDINQGTFEKKIQLGIIRRIHKHLFQCAICTKSVCGILKGLVKIEQELNVDTDNYIDLFHYHLSTCKQCSVFNWVELDYFLSEEQNKKAERILAEIQGRKSDKTYGVWKRVNGSAWGK